MSTRESLTSADGGRSGPVRRLVGLVIMISGGAVLVAQRDLARRPASEIRGPRWLWRLGSLNAPIALAYLRVGRIRTAG